MGQSGVERLRPLGRSGAAVRGAGAATAAGAGRKRSLRVGRSGENRIRRDCPVCLEGAAPLRPASCAGGCRDSSISAASGRSNRSPRQLRCREAEASPCAPARRPEQARARPRLAHSHSGESEAHGALFPCKRGNASPTSRCSRSRECRRVENRRSECSCSSMAPGLDSLLVWR